RGNLEFLYLHSNALSDFEREERVAYLDHLAEKAARSNDFVARGKFRDQRLMLLGLFLLGPDQEEVEDDDEDNHHQQRRHAAGAAGRSTLCPGIGNQSVHAVTLVGRAPPSLAAGGAKGRHYAIAPAAARPEAAPAPVAAAVSPRSLPDPLSGRV